MLVSRLLFFVCFAMFFNKNGVVSLPTILFSFILDIDLENQQIGRPNGETINFEIDEFRKHCLINGLDDIGLTMQKQSNIDDFEKKREAEKPWI